MTGASGPLAGMVVIAADFSSGRVKGAITNASGAYSITGIPPSAAYRIEFIDPTGANLGEWHDDQPLNLVANATTMNLGAGSSTTINAFLSDDPGA